MKPDHKKPLILLLFLLCIIALLLIFFNYRKRIEERAGRLYRYASELYLGHYQNIEEEIAVIFPDRERQEESPLEYKQILKKREKIYNEVNQVLMEIHGRFPSTGYGERALYNTAYLNFRKNNVKACMKILRRYLDLYDERGFFYIPCIKNIICIYVITGEKEKAREFLDKYISRDGLSGDSYPDILLFQAGLLYLEEDTGKAYEILRLIADKSSDSSLREKALEYMPSEVNTGKDGSNIMNEKHIRSVFEALLFDEITDIEVLFSPK